MLSVKQNLRETIRLGHPDRFVSQYEYLELVLDHGRSGKHLPRRL